MTASSIPAPSVAWRWHQAFAICLNFLWPAWGNSYLGLDEREDAWSAKCGMLYALAFLVWMLVMPAGTLQLFVVGGLLLALITWGSALWSLPYILKSCRLSTRVYKPYAAIVPVIWIALAVFNIVAFSPWAHLTIMTAPASASPLLPSGTPYFAVGFDNVDQSLNRGQLVTYRAGQEMRIARIIGAPGDVVRVDRTSFFVNGMQYTATTDHADNRDFWSLHYLAQGLRHPEKVHTTTLIDVEDLTAALVSAPEDSVTRVGWREFLVANEYDLLEMPERALKPALIKVDDVVAVPVAKVWSVSKPGYSSDIAQPSLDFDGW